MEIREDETRPTDIRSDPLIEWKETAEQPYAARLHRDGSGYRLWISGSGWFSIDPRAPSISVPASDEPIRREVRLWGMPALLCFLHRGDVPLHAAAIEVDGGAVLLAAPRTFGKTTLAAAFHQAGHRVLSEDTTCIRMVAPPAVVPGPALLRLRPDVGQHLELIDAHRVGPDLERLHYSLDSRRRGDDRPVPLRALIVLESATERLDLRRLQAAEALRDLWALSFRLPTTADVKQSFAAVADLTRQVPAWKLSRPMRLEELGHVVATIRERI